MPARDRPPTHDTRHQRVLGYLGLHLSRQGYLPTVADLAQACRLRSASTAHTVLRDLERDGLLIRDGRTARLAEGLVRDPDADDADLWVLLRTLEMQSVCELGWARDGMSLINDLALLDWTLERAQQHVARLRAYDHVRVLLREPTAQTADRLEQVDRVMRAAAAAYVPLRSHLTTWLTYSAMGNAATARISRQIVERPSLTALHLAVDTDEDVRARADWRFCSRALNWGDAVIESAAHEIEQISDTATIVLRGFLSAELVDVMPEHAVTLADLQAPAA